MVMSLGPNFYNPVLLLLEICQTDTKTKLGLTTSKGEGSVGTCVFPWKYDGEWNYSCIGKTAYGGVGWCAFDKTYVSDRWGYCTENCPSMFSFSQNDRMYIFVFNNQTSNTLFISFFHLQNNR